MYQFTKFDLVLQTVSQSLWTTVDSCGCKCSSFALYRALQTRPFAIQLKPAISWDMSTL